MLKKDHWWGLLRLRKVKRGEKSAWKSYPELHWITLASSHRGLFPVIMSFTSFKTEPKRNSPLVGAAVVALCLFVEPADFVLFFFMFIFYEPAKMTDPGDRPGRTFLLVMGNDRIGSNERKTTNVRNSLIFKKGPNGDTSSRSIKLLLSFFKRHKKES